MSITPGLSGQTTDQPPIDFCRIEDVLTGLWERMVAIDCGLCLLEDEEQAASFTDLRDLLWEHINAAVELGGELSEGCKLIRPYLPTSNAVTGKWSSPTRVERFVSYALSIGICVALYGQKRHAYPANDANLATMRRMYLGGCSDVTSDVTSDDLHLAINEVRSARQRMADEHLKVPNEEADIDASLVDTGGENGFLGLRVTGNYLTRKIAGKPKSIPLSERQKKIITKMISGGEHGVTTAWVESNDDGEKTGRKAFKSSLKDALSVLRVTMPRGEWRLIDADQR